MLLLYLKGDEKSVKRLSEKEKREICLQFYSGEKTKSELARRFQVSHTAIKNMGILDTWRREGAY